MNWGVLVWNWGGLNWGALVWNWREGTEGFWCRTEGFLVWNWGVCWTEGFLVWNWGILGLKRSGHFVWNWCVEMRGGLRAERDPHISYFLSIVESFQPARVCFKNVVHLFLRVILAYPNLHKFRKALQKLEHAIKSFSCQTIVMMFYLSSKNNRFLCKITLIRLQKDVLL